MISVIITTQNRLEDLARLLPELEKVDIPDFEVIIVDNNSTDDSVEFVSTNYPDVKLIKLHWNAAGITGRNIAAKNAKNSILISLDDDAIITPKTFQKILDQFNKDKNLGVISCSVINGDRVADRDKYEKLLKEDKIGNKVFSATACGLAFKKDIFEKCGYWEDWGQEAPFELSLIIKCLSLDYHVKRYKDINVFHYHSPSVSRNSLLAQFSSTKSWVWWYIKFYPMKAAIKNIIRIIYLSCYALIEQRTLLYILAVFSSIKDIPKIFMKERKVYSINILEKIRTTDNFKGG